MHDNIKLRANPNKLPKFITNNPDKSDVDYDNITANKIEEKYLKETTNYNELIVNHHILYNYLYYNILFLA